MKDAEQARGNRGGRKKVLPRFVMALTLLIIFFVGLFVYQGYKMWQLNAEQKNVQQQLTELRQRNKELEAERERLSDPKYIESVARDELGLVRPGEVPYIK